jgi:GT2 family glycosyltransferase
VDTIACKRNVLLDMAKAAQADYFLMLDSDVIVPPGGISALIDAINRVPRAHGGDSRRTQVAGLSSRIP